MGERERERKKVEIKKHSQLTWVKHDVQVQRARRAARDVLPHGELLLFFFVVVVVVVEVENKVVRRKIRKVRLLSLLLTRSRLAVPFRPLLEENRAVDDHLQIYLCPSTRPQRDCKVA